MNRIVKPTRSRANRTPLWPLAWSLLLGITAVPALGQVLAPRPSVNLPPELSALRLPDEGSFAFIELQAARAKFRVDGSGLGVAIVSSGINIRHKSFAEGKILAARNFSGSQENEDVRDESGEGSGLAATVAGLPLRTSEVGSRRAPESSRSRSSVPTGRGLLTNRSTTRCNGSRPIGGFRAV